MKLTILFVVVVGAILVLWLRSVKSKRNLLEEEGHPTEMALKY
jgi:heme exporter protein D